MINFQNHLITILVFGFDSIFLFASSTVVALILVVLAVYIESIRTFDDCLNVAICSHLRTDEKENFLEIRPDVRYITTEIAPYCRTENQRERHAPLPDPNYPKKDIVSYPSSGRHKVLGNNLDYGHFYCSHPRDEKLKLYFSLTVVCKC